MTVETKFNMHEDMWFMNSNIPVCASCDRIYVEISPNIKENIVKISYAPQGYVLRLKEELCFKTKQELIDSL